MQDLNDHISGLRRDYGKKSLTETEAGEDPMKLFGLWFSECLDSGLSDPNAACLATANAHGEVSQRIVLLRGFSGEGFCFYTNYNSRKGKDISENPKASMLFFWHEPERQVRLEGVVSMLDEADSDSYFASRPRESQIGAWVSQQSSVIASREELESRYREMEKKFSGREVPRPPYWGGYLLKHELMEFWQGRPNRLHDRLRYIRTVGGWKRERLSP